MGKIEISPIESDFPTIVPVVQRLPEFVHFIKWYATPKHYRNPKTQKELAELIGVNQDTLTDWKRHPQFQLIVLRLVNQWVVERVPDVIGSLYDSAMADGKAGEVRAFLQLAGILEINKNKK